MCLFSCVCAVVYCRFKTDKQCKKKLRVFWRLHESEHTQKDMNLQGVKPLKLTASLLGNGAMMLPSELLFGALCGIFVLLLSSVSYRFLPGGMRTNANRVETSEELQAFPPYSVCCFSFKGKITTQECPG